MFIQQDEIFLGDKEQNETTALRTLTLQFIKLTRDIVENILDFGDSNVLQCVYPAVGDCEDEQIELEHCGVCIALLPQPEILTLQRFIQRDKACLKRSKPCYEAQKEKA